MYSLIFTGCPSRSRIGWVDFELLCSTILPTYSASAANLPCVPEPSRTRQKLGQQKSRSTQPGYVSDQMAHLEVFTFYHCTVYLKRREIIIFNKHYIKHRFWDSKIHVHLYLSIYYSWRTARLFKQDWAASPSFILGLNPPVKYYYPLPSLVIEGEEAASEQEAKISSKVCYEVGHLIDEVLCPLVVHATKCVEMEHCFSWSKQWSQTLMLGHLL